MSRIVDFRFLILDDDTKSRNPKSIRNIVLSLILSILGASAVWACPLCKEALVDPGQLTQRLSMAKAYALSIGVLLAMPATLVGGVVALVIRSVMRNR